VISRLAEFDERPVAPGPALTGEVSAVVALLTMAVIAHPLRPSGAVGDYPSGPASFAGTTGADSASCSPRNLRETGRQHHRPR
jgi:hypothetical protein